MRRWVKAWAIALAAAAWLLGVPTAVGVWTGNAEWAWLAFCGAAGTAMFATWLAESDL